VKLQIILCEAVKMCHLTQLLIFFCLEKVAHGKDEVENCCTHSRPWQ